MCGRYFVTSPLDVLKARFLMSWADEESLGEQLDEHEGRIPIPSYNVPPGRLNPVVVLSETGTRRLVWMRWGLPSPRRGRPLINARAESVLGSSRWRRGLVLANGFFEWCGRSTRRMRGPIAFQLRDREPFAFAGVWLGGVETRGETAGSNPAGFAIVTTPPNDVVRDVHDRMPAILRRDAEEAWLREPGKARLAELLTPVTAGEIESYEVSLLVNSSEKNEPRCLEPVPSLF